MNKLALVLLLSTIFYQKINAQSIPCPFINAGPDQSADCSVSGGCSNLAATYLDIRETSSYTVESIPHTTPIAYNQGGGTGVSVNTDDVWSNAINLPFPFCFYGQTYNQILIGSNGNLNFNLASAGGYCPWSFTASCPSPNLVNMGNIFGVYHDIDPSVCGNIRYYINGSAPCRQLIVSYDLICHFSCTSIKSRHMMVLNETTNYIDVYVESKPLCTGWNGGRAIIGLQNPAGTQGITAPNRNSAPTWTVTTPEAWRFKPAGNELYAIEWFQGATSIGTGETITVCPSTQTTYTAQFTYTKCGSNTPTILTDDVVVTPPPGAINASISPTNSTCGQSNGSVLISATGGSGTLSYSSDNVNYVSANNFSGLSPGNYIFYVQDQGGCTVSLPIQIIDLSTLTASADSVPTLCFGASNGAINILASGGTQPYTYVLGTGSPQNGNIFSNLSAGSYNITVFDSQGCQVNLNQVVTEPIELQLSEVSTTNSFCNLPNGGLEVIASGGITPYIYSIDAFISSQSTGIFSNITATNYNVQVNDGNGCSAQLNVLVEGDNSVIAVPGIITSPSCFGYNDGGLVINTSGGPAPYLFSLNNAPYGIDSVFNNLPAGNYLLTVQDANGCLDTVTMTIVEPTILTSDSGFPVSICIGSSVNLTGSASGGTPPYTYLWNGNAQNPFTYAPLASQTEQFIVIDANGCADTTQVLTTVLPFPISSFSASPASGGVPLIVTASNLSQNANSFEWNFGNGSSMITSDLSSVNTTYTVDGTFEIELIASNGLCQDTSYFTIVVIPVLPLEVIIPNVFSPNADGSNEGYYVYTKNAASIEAIIVDRWGIQMAEINDLNYKWDGKTSSGKDATDGVYFIKYKVLGLDGKEVSGHTFFHLIR